jgi:hypothetical protein
MTAQALLKDLENHHIQLRLVDNELKVRAPKGVVTKEIRALVHEYKAELIELLSGTASPALTKTASPPPTDAINRVPTYTGNKLPSGRDKQGLYIPGNKLPSRRDKSGSYISGNKLPQSYPSSDLSAESVETQFITSFRGGEAKLSQLKNKRLWVIGLTALLVLALLGSGLITRMLLFPPSTTPPAGETVIGHVSFIKNGASPNYNAVQIDIAHVPNPPQGMAYYAWIELMNGQASENTIPPHWKLTVSNQAIHTGQQTFAGFDNLYVPPSLFLITTEQTDNPPIVPDPVARLYYARVTSATIDLKQCPASNTATVCFS